MILSFIVIYIIAFIVSLLILVIGTVDFTRDRQHIIIALLDSSFLAAIWPISLFIIVYNEVKSQQ